jgi:hypothetical protein
MPSFMSQSEFVIRNKLILRWATDGGICLPKVLKNTTNMFSKYNILSQVPSTLR